MSSGNPLLPSGSPTPALDGRAPVFVEHGADPRDAPGFAAPPFSVLKFGDLYFQKCGTADTDWTEPSCDCAGSGFRFLTKIPVRSSYLDSGFTGPLTLVFSAAVEAATVILGSSLQLTGAALGNLGTITFDVVSNTIVLHNDVGGGDEWFADGPLNITMTAAILSAAADPLQQPAATSITWVVS